MVRLKDESGYSLVEVMVSIMILTAAIIPMITMFDTGLRSATRGGSYDTARAISNKQLERAKDLSYDTVKDNFPFNAPTAASMTGGTYNNNASPITSTALPHQVPRGFSYSVRKQFVNVPSGATAFGSSSTDQGMIRVEITVRWDGNTYTTTGLKAQ